MPINKINHPDDVMGIVTDKGGWMNKHHDIPSTQRGDTFWAPEKYIKSLKARGMADFYTPPGPSKTKPAGPSTLKGKTKKELYEMASEKDISGRSNMSKAELIKALS